MDLLNFDYLLQPGTDTPVEYIPVDDWFDKYLENLNFAQDGEPAAGMAKGARIEAAELPDSGENGGHTDSSTLYGGSPHDSLSPASGNGSATVTSAQQPSTTMSRSGSEASAGASVPATPQGYATSILAAGQQQMPIAAPPIVSGAPPVTSGAHPVTSGAVITGPTIGGPPPVMSGGGSAIVSGMPDQLRDRNVPQPKQKRRRVRDERQQMLNKLAQIRYRERKRGRTDELQGDISVMEAQLAELQVRQAENADLAQQNRALEAQIEAKGASIADAQRARGASPSSPSGGAGSPTALGSPERGALPRDTPEDLDRLVKDWLAKSKEIISLVELIGLGDGNKSSVGRLKNDVRRSVRKTFSPKTRDVLKHVEQRMGEMVSDVTTLCMRVMRLQGAQVQQLMTADYEMVCSMKGWKDEGKWLKAARDLNFSAEQRKRVLAAREEALGKLNQLYGERQALNMQILNGLQPGLFAPNAADDAATAAAKQMVALLDALGTNLESEQQELARQDFVLFRQLLTPIQSGLLVAISFPDHCDALALMNAVYAVAMDTATS